MEGWECFDRKVPIILWCELSEKKGRAPPIPSAHFLCRVYGVCQLGFERGGRCEDTKGKA